MYVEILTNIKMFLSKKEINYLEKENIFLSGKYKNNGIYQQLLFPSKESFFDFLISYKSRYNYKTVKATIVDVRNSDHGIWKKIMLSVDGVNNRVKL